MKNLKEMTNEELIKLIDTQDTWESDEFAELLKRARIDPTAEPYVIDNEAQIEPDTIYEEAKQKLCK